ncbi:MAG TPA: preprotein translocase subunit SecE [Candidatus Binatia bacterium]|nr:preprotein translocase subunit SecE [Candidatus Binatia bacterium]
MEVQERKVAQAVKSMVNQGSGSGASGGEREGLGRPAWLERLLEGPRNFKKFLHDVRVEMTHTTWPTPQEVRSTTLIVIVTIFFFGAFFFVVDLGVGRVVAYILKLGKL